MYHANLTKGTYYKYYLAAYKVVNGKKELISVSKTIHVTTAGGKQTDIKGVKTNKTTISLKKGKKFNLKATEVKLKKSKKIVRHTKLRFESSNAMIATVTAKGVMKGNKKGTCYIYVYAQNGTYKKVKVKVK